MGEFEARIEQTLRSLEPGQVVSYGWVAARAGRPGAARAVGNFLATARTDGAWWRVVRADGTLVAPSKARQKKLLEAEGVWVRDGRVVDPPVQRS
jgi:methylated-DNA-protein-cysteine methyltransferase related protein